MNSIPSSLLAIIHLHLTALLHWFSAEAYQRQLGRAKDHFLVRLNNSFEFGPLEKACADYHHRSGPGTVPTHTVPRLVRALLVKHLFDLSLRQLEAFIQWNLLAKWFVGYAIFEPGPDHATLARFEAWVMVHHQRTFFDEVLTQIDRAFPDEREKAQMGDTYAMQANAATEGLSGLLRHTCQRLLNALADVDRDAFAHVKGQLDLEALFGAEGEIKEFRLERSQRKERLQQTAIAALHCHAAVQTCLDERPDLVPHQCRMVAKQLDILAKILADELTFDFDEQGQVTGAHELPKKKKGSYRIASAADPDATYRVHGERIDFGFNISVAATDTFIRESRADTGSQPDAVAIPDLLTAQQEYHGLTPDKFIYDQAAGTGKSHADVDKATHGQTQLVAPLVDYRQENQRFGPDDFTLLPDGQALVCPNGVVSSTAYRSQSGEGRSFRFSAKQCVDCPLVQACRDDKVPEKNMRQLFISDHRSALAKARTYAQTPEFKEDLKLRATIERHIANLVRYHGGRQARRRGLNACDYQAKMNATAFNIRQWMRKLDRQTVAASP